MISRLVISLLLCAGLIDPAFAKPSKPQPIKTAPKPNHFVDFPLTRHQVRFIWAYGYLVECLSWAASSDLPGFMLCTQFQPSNKFTINDQLTADLFNSRYTSMIWPKYYAPDQNLGECEPLRKFDDDRALGCLGYQHLLSQLKKCIKSDPDHAQVTQQQCTRLNLILGWVKDIPAMPGSREAQDYISKEGN
jgi:hypothetical protein